MVASKGRFQKAFKNTHFNRTFTLRAFLGNKIVFHCNNCRNNQNPKMWSPFFKMNANLNDWSWQCRLVFFFLRDSPWPGQRFSSTSSALHTTEPGSVSKVCHELIRRLHLNDVVLKWMEMNELNECILTLIRRSRQPERWPTVTTSIYGTICRPFIG